MRRRSSSVNPPGGWRRYDKIGAFPSRRISARAGSIGGGLAGVIHHGHLDDLDRGIWPVRLPTTGVHQETGSQVRVVAVGTVQALKIGERGDCDVVFDHDTPSERAFVERGFGIDRREVMYNDFILVGPKSDPAHVDGGKDIVVAFRKIAEAKAPFVARGDDSGTSKTEMRSWKEAGIDPKTAGGGWYRDTGSGMGPTLNTVAAMDGYTLSDRGTWLSFKNKQNLTIVVEGDRRLFNQYGVMMVNPAKHPHVKPDLGRKFIDWR